MSTDTEFTYEVKYRLIRSYRDPATDENRSEDAAFEYLFNLHRAAVDEEMTQEALDETVSTMVGDNRWELEPGSYCVEGTVRKFNRERLWWSVDELTRRSAYVEVEEAGA